MVDRSNDRAIMLSLILNIDSLSISRNQAEKQLSIDITENEDYNSSNIKLTANNNVGTNPKSIKTINDIESFFYLYSPYETEVVFTNMDNTQFILKVINVTLLNASFKRVDIINRSTTDSLSIETIYS